MPSDRGARATDRAPTPDGTGRQRASVATTGGAHFLHDGLADSLYVLLPLWAQTFGLNYTQVGSLKTAYSAAMALFQMPAGMLGERLGARLPLAVGTILTGAAFAALAVAGGYVGLFVTILSFGLFSAVQHPLASAMIADAFPAGRRRSALGVYNFAGDLGKVVVAFGVATIAGLVGWQATVAGFGTLVAIAGVVLAVVLARYALGNPHPPEPLAAQAPQQARPTAGKRGAGERGLGLTDTRGYTLLSLIHAIDSGSRTGVLTLLPFVLIAKGATPALVGTALAAIFAGGAAGKLACGLLADRIGILRTVMATELATAALVLAALAAPLSATLVLMPLLGIALNGTSSVLYGTVTDFVKANRQARAYGFFYTIGSAAGGTSPLVLGALSDAIGLTPSIVTLAIVVLVTLPLAGLLRPHLVAH